MRDRRRKPRGNELPMTFFICITTQRLVERHRRLVADWCEAHDATPNDSSADVASRVAGDLEFGAGAGRDPADRFEPCAAGAHVNEEDCLAGPQERLLVAPEVRRQEALKQTTIGTCG